MSRLHVNAPGAHECAESTVAEGDKLGVPLAWRSMRKITPGEVDD